MRNVIVAASMLLALGLPAGAADLPPAGYPAAAPVVAPAPYNWTGVYGGINGGYGFATATATAGAFSASETLSGAVAGVQVGADYQAGWAVFGLEADADYSDQSESVVVGLVSGTDKIDWISTIRGRFGAAFDRFMPYVTAGGGWGQASTTVTVAGFGSATATSSRFIWTVGAGLDVGLMPNLSARIEYLYLDTGNFNIQTAVTGRVQDNLVRVGLNYRLPL